MKYALVAALTHDNAHVVHTRRLVTWTRPWTVAYPMVKTRGLIYEFACHEGNYGLKNILSGARAEEAAAEKKR